MNTLVGYTGFVGSNLALQHQFDQLYNSKNIKESFGLNPELCVYTGVRAEKFLANQDPEGDMAIIQDAIQNIQKINPRRLVLISTIDVFLNPKGMNEDTAIHTDGLQAYGYNRFQLEKWCSKNIENCHIIRLPGLFGKNIKKNFIYDIIHHVPPALSEAKYKEFSSKETLIRRCYIKQNNGFYKSYYQTEQELQGLRDAFERLEFSALHFTDSRASFQFYNLAFLWEHIKIAIQNKIDLLHLAVEPLSVNEIYCSVNGIDFVNEITAKPPMYDFKTKYDKMFGGNNGYIFSKKNVLKDILTFLQEAMP